MLGIHGYDPAWHHDAEALAAVHRTRFVRLIGRKLRSGWLMWDMAERGWFAARPSGTESIYKIYAESFKDQGHLDAIVSEAQAMVSKALESAR